MTDNLLIVYGFARTTQEQQCMQKYIIEKACSNSHVDFCEKFCTPVLEHILDYNTDAADGKGSFESLGICISLTSHKVGCIASIDEFTINKDYRKLLEDGLEKAGIRYGAMLCMYGVPAIHIFSYNVKI